MCFGQVISEKIVNDIKQSKFFTIIADEAADSSHKEQMALVLQFVDKKYGYKSPRSSLVSFSVSGD